jgi:hypothetical protein
LGIFAIFAFQLWWNCGEVVVKCVANVVSRRSFVVVLKTGQAFEVYFQGLENLVGVEDLDKENDRYGGQDDEQGDADLDPPTEGGQFEFQAFDLVGLVLDGDAG